LLCLRQIKTSFVFTQMTAQLVISFFKANLALIIIGVGGLAWYLFR